jgi:hypothetical protein
MIAPESMIRAWYFSVGLLDGFLWLLLEAMVVEAMVV